MRIFFQIFIIIFVILSLIIVKDDVASVYNKAVSYIKAHKSESQDTVEKALIPAKKTAEQTKTSSDKKETVSTTPKKATPGPLRVLNTLLTPDSSSVTLSVKGVVELTNQNRRENGNLAPLTENARLNLSAQRKLQDMFNQQYFEHVSPQGVGVEGLGTKAGYEYIIIGENLALGNFKDNKALLDAWMASPGHRANILGKGYTEIGVAVGKGMFEGKSTWLAVQHFGTPKSNCQDVDQVLYGMITVDKSRIKTMETDLATRKQHIDSGAVYEGKSHNEQVEKYNELVAIYNELIAQTKEKIATYNEQANAFNACVGGYTGA